MILRIALVGAPNTNKTKLIDEIRSRLKKDYNIFVAKNSMSDLVDAGCVPSFNISNIDFQLESLDKHLDTYCCIESYLENYCADKPTIIFYESLPLVEKAYLSTSNKEDLSRWDNLYEENAYIYEPHKPDKVYIVELPKGEYNHKGIVNSFDLQRALAVEERIADICMDSYSDYEVLSNDYSFDERVNIIANYINFVFNPPLSIFSGTLKNTTILQNCNYCYWNGNIDINHLYNFCPKCGQRLAHIGIDLLGEEARRKMFYVDPSKLPSYNSTVTYL